MYSKEDVDAATATAGLALLAWILTALFLVA